MDNPYLNRYMRESRILNPRPASGIENFMNLRDLHTVEVELLEREGNASGGYYNPGVRAGDGTNTHTALLPSLKAQLKTLNDQYKGYEKSVIASGGRPKPPWPSNLEEDRQKVDARIAVCKAEIDKLKELIKPMLEAKEAEETKPFPMKQWGAGELRDGHLIKIGGWDVKMPKGKDVLHIVDKRSPYHLMPVWRFKSQILKAISLEKNYRERLAVKEAIATGNRKIVPKPPQPPVYHHATNTIEYPDYDIKVLRKINTD